jgi:methionyl-tRNA formyltransferase
MSVPIVFFGTPAFSAQLLEYLIAHHVKIVGIVTQPDRPKGRSGQPIFSPVKLLAHQKLQGVPVWQPPKCSDPQFLADIAEVRADLFVVVAFGQILPQKLLSIPPLGCINVHASLLPKYRGAAPIHRAILNGDTQTGIAIQKMVKELDAGDVIAAEDVAIPSEMTFGELEQALCTCSKSLLLDVIRMYSKGAPPAEPQDVSGVTFAPKVTPEEGEINWQRPSSQLHCLIRAFNPRPGAWCWVAINGERKRVKIWRATRSPIRGHAGELLSMKEAVVGCGEGSLQLLEVQPEGKSRMTAADWLRGTKGSIQFKDLI